MLRPGRCAHCLVTLADHEGVERYACTMQVPPLCPRPGEVAYEVIGPPTHAVVIYRVCSICLDLGNIWGMYWALQRAGRRDWLVRLQMQLAGLVQDLVAMQRRP